MSEVIKVNPNILKPHPRNNEFFSDVEGEEFERLLDSIINNGILTPLRVTKDMTIISGHQRWKASMVAGLEEVPVVISDSIDNNNILIELIASNFGRAKNDPNKQAQWIKEYEELRGVRQGSAYQKADPNNSCQVTQSDIAKELGMSPDTIRNLKSLLELDPSIRTLISEGTISATTGFKLISKLSEEEQVQLLEMIPEDTKKKISGKQIQQYIDIIRNKDDEMKEVVKEKDDEINRLIESDGNLRNELEEAKRELEKVKTDSSTEKDRQIEEMKNKIKLLEKKAQENISSSMSVQDKDRERTKECFKNTTRYLSEFYQSVTNQLQKNSDTYGMMTQEEKNRLSCLIRQATKVISDIEGYVA